MTMLIQIEKAELLHVDFFVSWFSLNKLLLDSDYRQLHFDLHSLKWLGLPKAFVTSEASCYKSPKYKDDVTTVLTEKCTIV